MMSIEYALQWLAGEMIVHLMNFHLAIFLQREMPTKDSVLRYTYYLGHVNLKDTDSDWAIPVTSISRLFLHNQGSRYIGCCFPKSPKFYRLDFE